VRLWSFPDGRELHTLQDRKKTVSAVEISKDGKWVAAGSYGGRAMIWTLDGEGVIGIKASKKNLSAIAFSPDGRMLATSGLGDDVELWSLPSGDPLGTLKGHKTAVMFLRFVQDGEFLVSLGYEGVIKFWDTSNWQETRSLTSNVPGVRGLVFSPDEKFMALSLESLVQIWSVEDWSLKVELPVSTKVVNGMAFSPDGKWFAAGAADQKIRIWDRAQF
jgi:WD40 repeat protein